MDSIRVLHADAPKRRLSKMRKVLIGAVKGIEANLQESKTRYRVAFGTATYSHDDQWEPGHIRDLMRHYRQWHKRRRIPFQCVWVAELTKRGRVHYHWVFFLPRGITPPMPDKQGWWKHGSTNVKWARKPVGYLLKYATKSKFVDGHNFPKGARIFGVSGPCGHLGYFRCPAWMLPWARPYQKIVKRKGFWNNHDTGIGYRSPWIYESSDEDGLTLIWNGWGPDDWHFCNYEGFDDDL